MIDLKRILVPTDFSKHSQNALTYAAALAEKFGAEIYLFHVVQDLALYLPDAIAAAPPPTIPFTQLVTASREALAKVIREQLPAGVRATPEVREGSPLPDIIAFAKEKDIDLIVLGTHGRTGLVHVLMGSVAENVVRKAPCPVLTVRHPEHEFVHP
jgi:nucleotide-binding universal stress UspA family protein